MPQSHSPTRSLAIDALKGITVAAVVLVHVRFFHSAATGTPPTLPEQVLNTALHSFHLPTLFFAAGILVPGSLRRGAWPFVRRKIRTIGWPLLVWYVLNRVRALGLAGAWTLRDITNVSYLWFLVDLLLFCLLAAALHAVPARWLTVAVCAVIPVAAHTGVGDGARYACFFFAGVALGPRVRTWLGAARPAPLLSAAGLAGAFALSATRLLLAGPVAVEFARAGGVIAALLVWAAYASPTSPFTRIWAAIGRASLVVYVSHWPIGLFLAVNLRGTWDWGWSVALTLALTWLLAAFRDRRPVSYLTTWGG